MGRIWTVANRLPVSISDTIRPSAAHSKKLAEYRKSYGDRRIVLSVERLDYTKTASHF